MLCSCVSLEQVTVTDVIDYSRFTKNGIFVTESNSVNFNYEPVGSVISVSRGAVDNSFVSYRVDMDKAFSEVGKKLKELNADGLINLKISNTSDKYFYCITVTGMAIRRENNDIHKVTTYREVLGYIDDIKLEVIEAYSNGTKILTSSKMTVEQINKAWKKFFYKQPQTLFYTADGLANKLAYAGITDNQMALYDTNEFIPLK